LATHSNFIAAIGNTPLIRLNSLSDATGCEILGKAEFLNPGGSVKDRAAWWMIREHDRPCLQRPRLQLRDLYAGQPVTRKGQDAAHSGR